MQKIAIKDKYRFDDLSDQRVVEQVISFLEKDLDDEPIKELNLRHCLIDYPTTSTILDAILYHLSSINHTCELFIKIDYQLPQKTLMKLLFFGSKFVGSEEEVLEIEILEGLLENRLRDNNISVSIEMLNGAGDTINEFSYNK